MIRFAKIILSAGLNGLALGLLGLPATAAQPAAVPANLPLYFEANQGQAKGPAQFIARGRDYQFLISPVEAQMVLRKTVAESATVRMQFIGANAQAQISGDAELPGKINYLTGNDPAQWRTGVPMFAKVRVGELYPGISLVYYGNSQQLEYDFTLAPGTNPKVIAIRFNGADKIAVNAQGELILTLAGGEIRQPKPVIYQMAGGARKEVEGGYRLVDAHTVAFAVGQYDRTLPLVIDPILSYSTYFGGNLGDTAWAVAVDTNGFIYIAGQTFSSRLTNNVPLATPGAFQTNFAGGTLTGDAFVAKLDNLGTNLIYLTYLGGSDDDAIFGVAVDDAGDAYATGYTDSPNFPTSTNALYKTISGKVIPTGHYLIDAFVTELSPSGSNLIYSTYLGGSSVDSGIGIAVDSAGNAYVTGVTYSTNFPATNAFQKKLACTNSLYFNANAFIAKIGPNGTNLAYSTYFGGTNFDQGTGIAVDSSNFVYVTGFTASTNFPNTNSFQKYLNGSTNQTSANDAFVAKFDSTGTNLLYSTFLGGTNNDIATHIAVDNQGAAYVTGWTTSTNFPNTVASLPNGLVNSLNSYLVTNVFLTKITNGTGTNYAGIARSTLFGGNNIDIGYGVAVAAGCVFVTGSTSSTNFPTYSVPTLMRATNSGGNDAFIAAFDINAFGPIYSVCLGGNSDDFGYGVAVDPLGNANVVGQTLSANFLTRNARQTTLNGASDAFLTKIMLTVALPEIGTQPISQTNKVGSSVTFSVGITNGTPPFFFQWQIVGTNLIGTNLVDGGNISGTTGNILTINPAQVTNSGSYWLIVTNYGGSVTSSLAFLTVTNIPTVLTLQPTDQTVGVGSTVTFSVDGNAQPPFFLQWLKDGTNLVNGTNINGSTISGATNATLVISNAQTNDSGTYWIVVTNAWGVLASSNAVLTVVSFPTITVPPTNQTVGLGSVVTFAVTAVGTTPLSYRWQVNGTDLVNGGRIGGATNFALTITNAQTSDDGGYSVIITNIVGSVTSSPPAVLTVLLSPLFGSIIVEGGTNGFILSGAGGTNSGTYYVLTSSNLLVPRTNWTHIATNHFDSTGHFIFTNAAQTNAPQEFYLLQMP